MTAAELIELLQELPPETPICALNHHGEVVDADVYDDESQGYDADVGHWRLRYERSDTRDLELTPRAETVALIKG